MKDTSLGALRHRLALETPVRTSDEGGAAVVAWTLVADMWAEILPVSAREIVDADVLAGRILYDIRIRHRSGVGSPQRFRLGSRIFEILGSRDEDERRRWLVCRCEERVT